MKLFLDVDALHKLAGFDALDDALTLLGARRVDVWVLPTAKFKLRLKKPAEAEKRHGQQTANRLNEFVASVQECGDPPTDAETERLAAVPGIDAGELILIPLAAREPDGLLLTGDKNALRALASDPHCASFAARLAGRVVCLEQVLEALLRRQGFDWLHARVAAAAGLDRGISLIVSPGMSATAAHAQEGFTSFIEDLRRSTGDLLIARLRA